jgi:hypothetical protein
MSESLKFVHGSHSLGSDLYFMNETDLINFIEAEGIELEYWLDQVNLILYQKYLIPGEIVIMGYDSLNDRVWIEKASV